MDGPWSPLGADEPIGVVALSGPVDEQRLSAGLDALRKWGNPLLLAPNLNHRVGFLAGTDEQRLAGLEWVLDGGARVVMAARGGYGLTRLLARLPWQQMVRQKVCCVGFSDLTALANPLLKIGGAPQVHGPMVAAGITRRSNRQRLHQVLSGQLVGKTLFDLGRAQVVRPGRATGIAIGGNLTMLCALLGTPYQLAATAAVLFIEDVGEPLYRIDRMLTHLAVSGSLSHVKAVIGGSLRACRPAAERNGLWTRRLAEIAPADAIVVTGLPFGHGAVNMAFPMGVRVEVDTMSEQIVWSS